MAQQSISVASGFRWGAPRLGAITSLLPAIGLALAALAALAYMAFQPGPPGSAVAAIYAPDTPEEAAFAAVVAAGGRPIRSGGFANIVIASAEDPRFADRLRAAGAWLVVDAVALGACLRR